MRLGKNRDIVSIATNPPCLSAIGAIKPVSQSMRNRAASSGHGSALFITYRKNTWSKMTTTISARAIAETRLPI